MTACRHCGSTNEHCWWPGEGVLPCDEGEYVPPVIPPERAARDRDEARAEALRELDRANPATREAAIEFAVGGALDARAVREWCDARFGGR